MTNNLTTYRLLTAGFAGSLAIAATASGQSYEYEFQHKVGGDATFHVSGPATEGELQADAFLESVEMASGETYDIFYRPVRAFGLFYNGDPKKLGVRGGDETTVGIQGLVNAHTLDGDNSGISEEDVATFESEYAFEVFKNNNLNNYFDIGSADDPWSIIVEFELTVMDNDPEPDAHGELLYFERGSNYGNSWVTLTAVDESGEPLPGAQPLAIGPSETNATSPGFDVYRNGQGMGAAAIDVSRLGVTEFKYLKISAASPGVGGYTSGERYPDLKFMAVITNELQLNALQALYD